MKKGFLKAVNLFTGKRTLVPVTSPHYVTCFDCKNVDNMSQFAACSYCKGCLDSRSPYLKPLVCTINFNELLDRVQRYCLYDF